MSSSNDNLTQVRELRHPVRLCLWLMCESKPTRSLAPIDLYREMPPMPGVKLAQVSYHLHRLQRIGLVAQ